jgi:hypothetical protein
LHFEQVIMSLTTVCGPNTRWKPIKNVSGACQDSLDLITEASLKNLFCEKSTGWSKKVSPIEIFFCSSLLKVLIDLFYVEICWTNLIKVAILAFWLHTFKSKIRVEIWFKELHPKLNIGTNIAISCALEQNSQKNIRSLHSTYIIYVC